MLPAVTIHSPPVKDLTPLVKIFDHCYYRLQCASIQVPNSSCQILLIPTATATYGLEHGLLTVTAIYSLTEPSTLSGTVKEASAFGLSNNKWQWWIDCSSLATDSQFKTADLV